MASKSKTPSDHDLSLWGHILKDVRPLPGRVKPQPAPVTARQGPTLDVAEIRQPASRQKAAPLRPSPHLDGSTARKVRRGRQDVDATLDLHGMRQNEAHAALQRFVTAAYSRGDRCLLVVTGKGRMTAPADRRWAAMQGHGASGILKTRFFDWLSLDPLASLIYAYAAAHQTHGGGGAFYVFLRRNPALPRSHR